MKRRIGRVVILYGADAPRLLMAQPAAPNYDRLAKGPSHYREGEGVSDLAMATQRPAAAFLPLGSP
jgi:hypothetical protein